jgi:hypothetical protein
LPQRKPHQPVDGRDGASQPESGYVAHRTAGRTRIRIPGRRGDSGFFSRAAEELAACGGISSAIANPVTGSILVWHTCDITEVAQHAAGRGLFVLIGTEPTELPLTDKLLERISDADLEVRRLSGGEIDLGSIAFLTLLSIGLVQLLRGNVVAPAITLLFYAASTIAARPRSNRSFDGLSSPFEQRPVGT